MKYLVTGATGFLGQYVVDQLFHAGYQVTAVGGTTGKSLHNDRVALYSWEHLGQIDVQPDVIIACHAAVSSGATALSREVLFQGNVVSTERFMQQFPSARYVYCSSISVYKPAVEAITENSCLHPLTDYALSKLWGEHVAMGAKSHAVVRFSSLYGEEMRERTLIPNYINQAMQNGEIPVWGKGLRRQNYLHVRDAARLLCQVAQSDHCGVFLGTGEGEHSNLEIAEMIAGETGAKIVFTGEDPSASYRYDNHQTRTLISWSPSVSIQTGIREYIQWKRKQF